jgi:hypothetical protein
MRRRPAIRDESETQKLFRDFGESSASDWLASGSIFRFIVNFHGVEFASLPVSKQRTAQIFRKTLEPGNLNALPR